MTRRGEVPRKVYQWFLEANSSTDGQAEAWLAGHGSGEEVLHTDVYDNTGHLHSVWEVSHLLICELRMAMETDAGLRTMFTVFNRSNGYVTLRRVELSFKRAKENPVVVSKESKGVSDAEIVENET